MRRRLSRNGTIHQDSTGRTFITDAETATLTYDQLVAEAFVSNIVTLECVGNTVAGESISMAQWEWPTLHSLLEKAGAKNRRI